MHTLITGSPGAGKSTLIRRVLDELERPLSGFLTKKEAPAPEGGGCPVRLYPFGGQPRLLGFSDRRLLELYPEVFEDYARELRRCAPAGQLIVMDELGVMESRSPAFCAAVLELLEGDIPVLAAVKDKDTPFLQAVRAHPRCRVFTVTGKNREAMFPQVLSFVRAQLPPL